MKNGFTLLEILISVGILAVATTLIVQVLFTTTRVNTKTGLVSDVKQNGEFALDSMERAIRASTSIPGFCELGATSTTSALITDANNNSITYACVSDGTAARIASVSSTGIRYLTSANVTISDSGSPGCDDSTLIFSCPDSNGIASPLTIRFTLVQLGATTSAFAAARSTFETTVSIRR